MKIDLVKMKKFIYFMNCIEPIQSIQFEKVNEKNHFIHFKKMIVFHNLDLIQKKHHILFEERQNNLVDKKLFNSVQKRNR